MAAMCLRAVTVYLTVSMPILERPYTKPGYERFFAYTEEFNWACFLISCGGFRRGAWQEWIYDDRRQILYVRMLKDPAVLRKFGFNEKEAPI